MSRWLDDQVVLLTGGGSGLGLAQVERFRAEGARVGVLEIAPERCRALEDRFGPGLLVHEGDATQYATNAAFVDAAIERFGRIDTIVANTGLWDFCAPLEELPADERLSSAFTDLFAVNVLSYLLIARAGVAALRASRGSLVLTASPAAFHAGNGGPLYVASKHAVVGLVRQLAYDLAPDVRVNGVSPGAIASGLRGPAALGQAGRTLADGTHDGVISRLSPLAVLPQATDYTGPYVLLASRQNASTITGEVIEADGGERVRGRWASEQAREGSRADGQTRPR